MRIPWGGAHRPFRLVCLVAALLCFPAAGAAQEAGKDKTGVELVPPSPKEKPLHAWHLDDTKSKKRVATVNGRWGFEPVPPGEYELFLHQYEVNVPYGTVKVSKDQITRIEVRAGVELVGRTAKEPPLYRWLLVDPKTKKAITNVEGRWGFTPIPPGEYELHVQKYEAPIRYATVQVGKDKPTRVEVKSGVEVLGQTAKEPPLYRWLIVDAKTKETVTYADTRWGFTPVPPGEYELQIQKYEAPMTWSKIKVENNKSTRVDIKSGVEVVGNSPKEKPLYRWSLVDPQSKKVITYANARWGFTPAPPGEYELRVQFYEEEIPFTTVRVAKDKIARVEVKSGIELVGHSPKDPPLDRWTVLDPKTNKPVTSVSGRWGFTPLPPGEYALQVRPRNSEAFDWGVVSIKPGQISSVKMDSGIEILPREANEKPPAHWYVYDVSKKTRKPMTDIRKRWGFVLLPPGEYAITDKQGSFPLIKAKVAEHEVVKVQIPDLPSRLAAVTGAGRPTEKQRDPEGYKKLEEEVERAIRRGAAWLKKERPMIPRPLDLRDEYPTLGVLALLHAGEFERDPALAEQCLDYLLRRRLDSGTYSAALTAMALSDMDPFGQSRRILECGQWLVENQRWNTKQNVWGYGDSVPGIGELKKERITVVTAPEPGSLEIVRRGLVQKPRDYWDNSCSQFAVLGLHSVAHAGIKVPKEVWERVASHFREVHDGDDGGWSYHKGTCTGSMTCAGIASLLLAQHHLGEKKPTLDPAIVSGLEWLAGHFNLDKNPGSTGDHYYSLYGLERVGVLAGTEFLGDHEWYPEGARYLLKNQKPDGSWQSKTGAPAGSHNVYQDTCYAILFLRRATLPPVPPKPGMIEVVYKQPKLPPAIVPNIELVLDCSGSMDFKIQGGDDKRMPVARRAMEKLLEEIPDHFNVGFRVFGHQGFWDWRTKKQAPDNHPGWYTDTELLIPITPLGKTREAMRKWINYMEPAGATPLCYALLQARKDFHDSMKGPKAVILISDGLENCKGRMEDVEKAYKGSGIDVVIHVVGFAVTEKEHKVLELLAKWTKGNYYRADDASQLAKALQDAAGSLQYVVQNEGGRVVAQGLLNGPGVTLKAGSYRVSIQGIREAPLQVQVQSDQRLRLTLDNSGKLIVAGKETP